MEPVKVTNGFVPPPAVELVEHNQSENCGDTLARQQHLGTHPEGEQVSMENEEEKVGNSQQVSNAVSIDHTSPSSPCRKTDPLEGGCDGESPAPVAINSQQINSIKGPGQGTASGRSDGSVDTSLSKKKYKPWPAQEPIKPVKEEKPKKENKPFKFKFNFWKIFSIFSIIIFIALTCGYLYMVNEGKMTPIFSQNNSFEPIVNVDNPTINNFDFEPENNFTIINEVVCPDVTCNCGNNS